MPVEALSVIGFTKRIISRALSRSGWRGQSRSSDRCLCRLGYRRSRR